jgi:hypothetical protein
MITRLGFLGSTRTGTDAPGWSWNRRTPGATSLTLASYGWCPGTVTCNTSLKIGVTR